MTKFSIIIPVYNKETSIERCVNSVLKQSFSDFEIIIIDDGSTDNSKEILQSYENSKVKCFYTNNRGVSAARNYGISRASGDYLFFLDADDYYHFTFLESFNRVLPFDLAYCGYNIDNGHTIFERKTHLKSKDLFKNYLKNKTSLQTACFGISKNILKNHEVSFNTALNWGEDVLFFSEVIMNSKKIKTINNYLIYHSIDQGETLSKNDISKIEKDKLWIELLCKKLDKSKFKSYKKYLISYRLPASVIYNLLSNKSSLKYSEQLILLYKNRKEILQLYKMVNGLRSFKLNIEFIKILIKWE